MLMVSFPPLVTTLRENSILVRDCCWKWKSDTKLLYFMSISRNFYILSGKYMKSESAIILNNVLQGFGLSIRMILMLKTLMEINVLKLYNSWGNIQSTTQLDLLKCVCKYSLIGAYPNITIFVRIFLILPVTVACCERSFSNLLKSTSA